MSEEYRMKTTILFLILGTLAFYGCGGGNSGTGTQLTAGSLVAPHVNQADIDYVGSYSESAGTPLGRIHNGLDFRTTGQRKPFRAVATGSITKILLWKTNTFGNWQVNVRLTFKGGFAEYAFEPMTTAKSDGQAQHSSILVSEGDTVTQGQVIGYLHKGHPSHTHVHLGLYVDGNTICPAKYFNDAARASIQSLTRGGAPLCY
jgi:murein DD-endopeptidase MepM/ murein hydrolase activator NlpD